MSSFLHQRGFSYALNRRDLPGGPDIRTSTKNSARNSPAASDLRYAIAMDQDHRASPRVAVSIKMQCPAAEGGSLRLHDLSIGGFLAGGAIAATVGDGIEGTIHVLPSSGDRDVWISGTIVRVLIDGGESFLGVRIDRFASAEEERAYLEFARELDEDG